MVLRWSGLYDMTPEQKQMLSTYYYAKITLIDDYIGRILNVLEEKGLLDNTWIIYNSDHGEMLGDHMMSHKIVFYDGPVRIPLIIRPPGGAKGWQCKGLTDHLDIAASLIDIAQAETLSGSDGRSLIPQVLNGPNNPEAQKGKEVIFSEVYGYSMVFDGRYKMAINPITRTPVEFYDLKEDPDELKNLVDDYAYESIRKELLHKHFGRLLKHLDKKKFENMNVGSRRRQIEKELEKEQEVT
ncbi:MAG: sulfatase-like hydrolase/transferase [Candidatus Hodarchaeota archaeon]